MSAIARNTPDLDTERLRALLRAGRAKARRRGQPCLVSLARLIPSIDPLAFFARGANLAAERSFWSRPDQGIGMAGVGAAWTRELRGQTRFTDAAEAWRELMADALIEGEGKTIGAGPLLFGGFAFDPQRPSTALWEGFPDGRLTLPRFLLSQSGPQTWLTVNAVIEPEAEVAEILASTLPAMAGLDAARAVAPPVAPNGGITPLEDDEAAAAWQDLVAAAVQCLQAGSLDKVVLARAARVRAGARLDPAQTLGQLRARYPHCVTFAFTGGDRCFLGATPEQLVSLRGRELRTMCLAGTAARGKTEAQDRQLGEELLASAKNRFEHAIVVRALREALGRLGIDPEVGTEPILLKLENLQHLLTPVLAQVHPGQSILDLVGQLHPTPAVGGYPRDAALSLIREREGLDRGWYAGPIGWVDAAGGGEFAVALRSALLTSATATLFAGCGIVADSDPASEYAESMLKLRPILTALGGARRAAD